MPTFSRFLLDQDLAAPGLYPLNAQESHHAMNVLRLGVGDAVVVFDGKGRHAEAVIAWAGKDGVAVTVDAIMTEERLPLRLSLATAIPKGKRWQALVEKCTELGVDRIIPMLTERSVCKGEGDSDKWRRWIVEAAKQCRRSLLPEIVEPMSFAGALEVARRENALLFYADPAGDGPTRYQAILRGAGQALVLIGPEGGFSEKERAALDDAGARPLRLSAFTLRIETAAAVVCALIREAL